MIELTTDRFVRAFDPTAPDGDDVFRSETPRIVRSRQRVDLPVEDVGPCTITREEYHRRYAA
jgi:hypothetical protein